MKQGIILLLFFIICIAPLGADGFFVTYVDGRVEVSRNGVWQAISISDSLPASGSVRLEGNALLEISFGDNVFTIYEPGVYALQDFIASSSKIQALDFWGAVDSKVRRAAGDDEYKYRRDAAAGVRGEKSDAGGELMWADESADPIPAGTKLINAGKYGEAIGYFRNAMGSLHDPNFDPFIYFYLGYAYSQHKEKAQALKVLNLIMITHEHPLYPDFVLLKGRLLLDSLSYKRAIELFEAYVKQFPNGSTAQTVYLLSAYCYQGLGDKQKTKYALASAQELDPASEIGLEAAALLKEWK